MLRPAEPEQAPKPLPYCARCQANEGERCGICDEADYVDGSGRRQREARAREASNDRS
jgi:hypothetical protein